jgi:hypothetical protein
MYLIAICLKFSLKDLILSHNPISKSRLIPIDYASSTSKERYHNYLEVTETISQPQA